MGKHLSSCCICALLFGACGQTSEHRAPDPDLAALEASQAEADEPESSPTLEAPEPWPTPVLDYSLHRPTNLRTLRVTSEHDAQIEVRSARGPRAPGCEVGSPLTPVDGALSISPGASVSVCLKDEEGQVHARTDIAGWRSVPSVRFSRGRDGAPRAFVEFGRLDDDVEALVFVAAPMTVDDDEPRAPRRCLVDPVYPSDEEAPEHCEFACEGRVLGEVGRGVFEGVMASRAWEAPSYGAVHRPGSLALRVRVAEPSEGEDLVACVRASDGSLSTTGWFSGIREENGWQSWSECYWDSPSGVCSPGTPVQGSVLRAFDAGGAAVAATVRRVRVRRARARIFEVGGLELNLAVDEEVMNAEGEMIAARDLEVGDLLRHGGEALPIESAENIRRHVTRVDVEGVILFSRNGFAVRDMGREENAGGTPFDVAPFRVGPGPSDCSVELLVPANTATPVSVAAHRTSGPAFASAPADCRDARVGVDAATMELLAALGPATEVAVRLSGQGIECDVSYHVGLCGAEETAALWVQASPWCLPGGTQIETLAGPRAIETLRAGDHVRSFDGEETVARVLGLHVHEDQRLVEIRLDDGTLLEATPEHVVIAGPRRRLRRARDLSPGDTLYGRHEGTGDGLGMAKAGERLARRRVVSVREGRRARVYELRVSEPDTYFANGILVHNY